MFALWGPFLRVSLSCLSLYISVCFCLPLSVPQAFDLTNEHRYQERKLRHRAREIRFKINLAFNLVGIWRPLPSEADGDEEREADEKVRWALFLDFGVCPWFWVCFCRAHPLVFVVRAPACCLAHFCAGLSLSVGLVDSLPGSLSDAFHYLQEIPAVGQEDDMDTEPGSFACFSAVVCLLAVVCLRAFGLCYLVCLSRCCFCWYPCRASGHERPVVQTQRNRETKPAQMTVRESQMTPTQRNTQRKRKTETEIRTHATRPNRRPKPKGKRTRKRQTGKKAQSKRKTQRWTWMSRLGRSKAKNEVGLLRSYFSQQLG